LRAKTNTPEAVEKVEVEVAEVGVEIGHDSMGGAKVAGQVEQAHRCDPRGVCL